MQTTLGFWCFQRTSTYFGTTYVIFCADDGFGNLIPSPCPTHTIQN